MKTDAKTPIGATKTPTSETKSAGTETKAAMTATEVADLTPPPPPTPPTHAPLPREFTMRPMPRAIKLRDGTRLAIAAIAAYRPEGDSDIVFLNARNVEIGRETFEADDRGEGLDSLDELFNCAG
jgi:hypothetical protein